MHEKRMPHMDKDIMDIYTCMSIFISGLKTQAAKIKSSDPANAKKSNQKLGMVIAFAFAIIAAIVLAIFIALVVVLV